MILAIDFDGTLVEHRFPAIGRAVPGAFDWLRTFQNAGVRLILSTMRSDDGGEGPMLAEAVAFCKENGVVFWAVNRNPEQDEWTTSPKVYAHHYIGDDALGCPLIDSTETDRPMVDWSIIGPMVMEIIAKKKADVELAASFDEAKHPRGQPENAGEFGPGGSGASPAPGSDAVPKKQAQEWNDAFAGKKTQPRGWIHQAEIKAALDKARGIKPTLEQMRAEGRVWVAFQPNQIKSVKNAGTFSQDDDDIGLSAHHDAPGQGKLWDEAEQVAAHPRGEHGQWAKAGKTGGMRLNEVTFFASGSNHSGEVRALSLIPGANVGTVASAVAENTPAVRELDRFAGTGRKVFIDSGAFSEVAFGPDGPRVIKPLTDDHWTRVFSTYAKAAMMHGPNAFVVAPDKVGFQAESLERLATYQDEVRDIHALGATVLVPIQKGELSMAEVYRQAHSILNAGEADGGIEFRPSIPMKKDATSLADLAEFCREIKPAGIHLLGIAPDTDKGKAAIQVVRDNSPATEISADACLIKRWVGRSNGRQGQPRRITELNDVHRAKLALDPEAVGEHEVHVRKALSLFLAAQDYWTGLSMAPVEAYSSLDIPADVAQDLEPAYKPLAAALWGKPVALSGSVPETAFDPPAAAIFNRAEAGAATVAGEIRRQALRQLQIMMKQNLSPQQLYADFMRSFRDILRRYEPVLARTASDAQLAAWLEGGSGVLRQLTLANFPRTAPAPTWLVGTGLGEAEPITRFSITADAGDLAARDVMTADEFFAEAALSRAGGFLVSRQACLDAMEKVRDALAKVAVAETGAAASAANAAAKARIFRLTAEQAFDASKLGPERQEVNLRHGLMQSYARGKKAIVEHPLVITSAVFVLRAQIDDSRLTPLCHDLSQSGIDGTNIYCVDDPVWRIVAPQSHFGCRCDSIFLTIERAAARGLKVARKWLATGIRPPDSELFVPVPDVEFPPGWHSPWAA